MAPLPTFSRAKLIRQAQFAALAAAFGLTLLPQAKAAGFDGRWSVLIVTQNGDCDPAYRYEINVDGGKLSYAGGGDFTVSGNVNGSGAVNVSIKRGEQGASGSGKLSGNAGSGKWSGKSATAACSGRWEATKQ